MNFSRTVLKNGLTLITVPMQGTQAMTLMVYVKVGSRYERKGVSGIAHFTEHMMFKGTKKRPTTLHISKELDGIGAEYNAFTSKEYTGYYIKSDKNYAELAIEVLSDMLLHPKFERKEVEREKGVIMEEINMYEDTPMMLAEDVFEQNIYGAHPLGRMIVGERKTVGGLSRRDFQSFYKAYYTPQNMIVAVSGALPDNIVSLVSTYFRKRKGKKPPLYRHIAPRVSRSSVHVRYKDTEQVHIACGMRLDISHTSCLRYPLQLVNVAFGGNMSSRLFIHIRERKGLCYYIRSHLNTYHDIGNWVVTAGLDKDRIHEAVCLIRKGWENIRAGITRSELAKAKRYIKGKLALTLEESSARAEWYAKQELVGLPLRTPDEFYHIIDKVSISEIRWALQRILSPRTAHLTVIGPFQKDDERTFAACLEKKV